MAQRKIYKLFDLNTSALHNERDIGVIKSGVYSGYLPTVNPATSGGVDLTTGSDGLSVLVTPFGVVVRESTTVENAVTVPFTTSTKDRWDLCVLTDPVNAGPNDLAQYELVRGVPADDPIKPTIPSDKVGICYIYVGGSAAAINQNNLFPIEKENWALAADISPLKPVIDVTNQKRIFVFPGTFPNSDNTTIVRFSGGYSEEISDTDISDGESKFVLFGIGDDGLIQILNESQTDNTTVAVAGVNVISLCMVSFRKSGSTSYIESLEDIRFPFTRKQTESVELDSYLTGLSTMNFQYVRVDNFSTNELIDVSTANTNYTVTHEYGFTRLKIQPNVWPLPDDFYIVTKDLVDSTPVDDIDHIMVVAEANTSDMTVDFSTNGISFAGVDYLLGTIIPAQSADSAYVKLKIKATEFTSITDVRYIYNYGVYFKLDPESLDVYRQGSLSLPSNINLIDNPFVSWSETSYALASSATELEQSVGLLGPDGWQVVYSDLSTISLFKTTFTDVNTPALHIDYAAGAGTTLELEYRIPVNGLVSGNTISFGFKYSGVSTVGAVAAGIRTYNYNNSLLTQKDYVTNAAIPNDSAVIVRSSTISDDVVAVGFVIQMNSTMASNTYIWSPEALWGNQYELSAVPSYDVSKILTVYERGRTVFTGNGFEGGIYSGSTKVTPKEETLGTPTIRMVGTSRSKNIKNLDFEYNNNTVITSAQSNASGEIKVDSDWECFVKFVLRIIT